MLRAPQVMDSEVSLQLESIKQRADVNAPFSKRRKDRIVSKRMAQPPPSRWLKFSPENEQRDSRTSGLKSGFGSWVFHLFVHSTSRYGSKSMREVMLCY